MAVRGLPTDYPLGVEEAEPGQHEDPRDYQKRMTIVISAQPTTSKWWCRGAMRKTRCPVSLKLAIWMMTEW